MNRQDLILHLQNQLVIMRALWVTAVENPEILPSLVAIHPEGS